MTIKNWLTACAVLACTIGAVVAPASAQPMMMRHYHHYPMMHHHHHPMMHRHRP